MEELTDQGFVDLFHYMRDTGLYAFSELIDNWKWLAQCGDMCANHEYIIEQVYGILSDYKGTPANTLLLTKRVLLYIKTIEESVGSIESLYISEQAKYYLSLVKDTMQQ